MCQWNTLNLFISIRSRLSLMTDLAMKCRDVSIRIPRWVNRGASRIWVPLIRYWGNETNHQTQEVLLL